MEIIEARSYASEANDTPPSLCRALGEERRHLQRQGPHRDSPLRQVDAAGHARGRDVPGRVPPRERLLSPIRPVRHARQPNCGLARVGAVHRGRGRRSAPSPAHLPRRDPRGPRVGEGGKTAPYASRYRRLHHRFERLCALFGPRHLPCGTVRANRCVPPVIRRVPTIRKGGCRLPVRRQRAPARLHDIWGDARPIRTSLRRPRVDSQRARYALRRRHSQRRCAPVEHQRHRPAHEAHSVRLLHLRLAFLHEEDLPMRSPAWGAR